LIEPGDELTQNRLHLSLQVVFLRSNLFSCHQQKLLAHKFIYRTATDAHTDTSE